MFCVCVIQTGDPPLGRLYYPYLISAEWKIILSVPKLSLGIPILVLFTLNNGNVSFCELLMKAFQHHQDYISMKPRLVFAYVIESSLDSGNQGFIHMEWSRRWLESTALCLCGIWIVKYLHYAPLCLQYLEEQINNTTKIGKSMQTASTKRDGVPCASLYVHDKWKAGPPIITLMNSYMQPYIAQWCDTWLMLGLVLADVLQSGDGRTVKHCAPEEQALQGMLYHSLEYTFMLI